MKKIIQFGEDVDGYEIKVLNEREIRAAAGIMFLMMFISLMMILFKENFVPIKYGITLFLTDMLIRVFINPKYSPSLIIGRLIVRNQTPEYVGAKQKKFAWIIGVILSATMFVFMVIINAYGPVSGITCLICLTFLFFEASFGICIGCKLYSLLFKEKVQYCPGEVCEVKDRQNIQKISSTQILIAFGFAAYIFLMSFFFSDYFHKEPYDIFGVNDKAKTK
jgi:hypothetical protein